MSTQPSSETLVPILKCMYPDCGNEWIPRTTHKPKVCPKCKRYGWDMGRIQRVKLKGGKKHVALPTHIGPKTEEFLEQHTEHDKYNEHNKKET